MPFFKISMNVRPKLALKMLNVKTQTDHMNALAWKDSKEMVQRHVQVYFSNIFPSVKYLKYRKQRPSLLSDLVGEKTSVYCANQKNVNTLIAWTFPLVYFFLYFFLLVYATIAKLFCKNKV